MLPSVADQFDNVVSVFEGFVFYCNENLAPDEPASADDTKPTRDAVDRLTAGLKRAVG